MPLVSINTSPSDPDEITFTIKKDDFSDFMADVLSQNKSICREIEGSFVISEDELKDILASIDQRVRLQNTALLTTFNITTFYEDRVDFTVESLDAYKTLRDIKQSEIIAVRVVITYLLTFPGRSKPEKQAISIFIRTEKYLRQQNKPRQLKELAERAAVPGEYLLAPGNIKIEIDYTDITWGTDLENLVSSQLQTKVKQPNEFLSLIRSFSLLAVPFSFWGLSP